MILTPLQKLPNNVSDLDKIIVTAECLPKKQKNRPIWSHWSQSQFSVNLD